MQTSSPLSTADSAPNAEQRPVPEPLVRSSAAAFSSIVSTSRISSLDALVQGGSTITVPRNRAIYFEGDPAEFCYRVVAGTVRICKETEDGRRQIAGFPTNGDLFGWAAPERYGYSAEAVTEVTLQRWLRQSIEQAIIGDADAGHRVLSVLFEQLAETQTHLLVLGRLRAGERIAAFLLSRAARHQRDAGHAERIPLPMGRKDIADYLGLTVETVSRTMHGLKQRGIIDFASGEGLRIHDPEMLDLISRGLEE